MFPSPNALILDWAVVSVASVGLYVLISAALAYLVLALFHARRFHGNVHPSACGGLPPVTVMKPLCGDEPGLYQCLKSFCLQDYPTYQIVFGVRDADDAAITVVDRLKSEFPDRDIALVVDSRVYGANLKVSNLINMMPACRHDMLVIADSDVSIGPDALATVMAELAEDGVGAISCLYRGYAMHGLASRLGALYINDWFLPSVLVDVALSGVDGCFGALMGVRREALEAIGDFRVLADHLAEDNLLGRLVRQQGWQVRLSHYTVDTMVGESRMSSLLDHEVRWSRTVRACRPRDHFFSLITFPLLPAALLSIIEPSLLGEFLVSVHMILRWALHFLVAARFPRKIPLGERLLDAALVPVRESLCFVVWSISLAGRTVRWRNRDYRIIADGRLQMSPSSDLQLSSSIPASASAPVGD